VQVSTVEEEIAYNTQLSKDKVITTPPSPNICRFDFLHQL
jgi:hypothetical protein